MSEEQARDVLAKHFETVAGTREMENQSPPKRFSDHWIFYLRKPGVGTFIVYDTKQIVDVNSVFSG